jgi:broad specificity phosphatase PhoE
MKIYLLRHVQTIENKHHQIQRPLAGNVSIQGRCDALYVTERLHIINPTAVYASPSERVRETLRHYTHTHPIIWSDALLERKYGAKAGLVWNDLQKKLQATGEPFHKQKYGRGESLEQVQKRVYAYVLNIITQSKTNDRVVIATHSGTIVTLLLQLLNLPLHEEVYNRHKVANASITTVQITRGNAALIEHNSLRHLLLDYADVHPTV